ncbi:flagellar basal-body MS-ring/collar protein FliF [Demequina mangrovi]|uniref:Flagellar M-ring protein n=1 Tax=Demequina mangrovi TaxID=1043493 RepID=A0A1H6ZXD0_9MICO|nr:flagellar basal-body MS-ring/collar protein FliF [Demequina mangrovi]SEJ56287.1 flagellar M-ring protein FliF [Demequina mangrovi]
MPAQVTQEWNRLRAYAGQMSVAQKVFASLLAGLLVVGLVALAQYTTRPTMSPLFTNLAADDAAAIVEQLDASGVPYELTAGGGTILVPQAQLYATRLAVASAGLPNGTATGYALLDGMSMTSSDFQQQVTYQRALEGELATTIGAMDGVTTASVKLALPQDTVFVDEREDPTASVFIATEAGRSLDTASVQAIVHLVSASIEGMETEDVAVIDADGVVLSTVGGGSTALEQGGQTADYENRVAASVQAMLDRVVGSGNAIVSVTAELDYDTRSTTSETFDSNPDAAPLSESSSVEEYSGDGGTTAAGVLGPDNISVPEGEESEGAYRKEDTVTNNAVDKTIEVTETAPGSVRRQSVSVVADEQAAGAIDLDDLTAMVAAAAGIDETRGDVVSVATMSFDSTAAEAATVALEEAAEADTAAATRAMYVSIAKWGALLLSVILVVVVALVKSRRRGDDLEERVALSVEAVEELEARAQAALEARTQALIDQAGVVADQAELALEAAPVPTMDAVALAIRDEIATFASQQPADVAEVLRGWIGSGRNA